MINSYEIRDGVCFIGTTSPSLGKVEFMIDPSDANRVKAFNWHPVRCSNGKIYAYSNFRQFESGKTKQVSISLHRLITSFESDLVDHANGNTLDNRDSSLRSATRAQNGQNRGATKASKTGLKGVYLNKRLNKFCAQIRANKVTYHLGVFKTKEEAAAAYGIAAEKYHGIFANLTHGSRVIDQAKGMK